MKLTNTTSLFFGMHLMNNLFKILLLILLLFSGQATLASPRSDANYIAQRSLDPDTLKLVQYHLKGSFATVYSKSLVELGIEIIDSDQFIRLIPEEDIAPYVDRFLSQAIENYLSIFTTEQLAFIAAALRRDKDASLQEVLSEDYRREYAAALKQARARAQTSGSDDPLVLELEEFIVQLDITTEVLKENAEAIGQSFAASVAPIFDLVRIGHEIQRLHREFDNPVTIAALKTDGILKFANPVQRQTLLRQFSAPDETDGVRFVQPPSRSVGSK